MAKNWTAAELVGEYFPNIGEDDAGFILWNQTAFPFGNLNDIRKQLERLRELRAQFPTAPLCEACNEVALRGSWCLPCWMALTPEPLLLTT